MTSYEQTNSNIRENNSTSEDFYDVYKQNVEKYFESVVDTIPQDLQSFTDIQSEWYKAWKTTISSVISLQQDFATKTGLNTEIPEDAKNALIDTSKQIIKANSVQNQIIQTTASTIQKNIQSWNNTANAFTDLNKNILQSWISTFTQPKN